MMNIDLCFVNPTVATYSSLRINKIIAARVDMENQRNGCMCLVAAAAARLMAMLCADPTKPGRDRAAGYLTPMLCL